MTLGALDVLVFKIKTSATLFVRRFTLFTANSIPQIENAMAMGTNSKNVMFLNILDPFQDFSHVEKAQ